MTPMIDSVIIELSGGYLGKIGSSARFSQEFQSRWQQDMTLRLFEH